MPTSLKNEQKCYEWGFYNTADLSTNLFFLQTRITVKFSHRKHSNLTNIIHYQMFKS